LDIRFMRKGKKEEGQSAISHRKFSLGTSHSGLTKKKSKKSKAEKKRIRKRNNST